MYILPSLTFISAPFVKMASGAAIYPYHYNEFSEYTKYEVCPIITFAQPGVSFGIPTRIKLVATRKTRLRTILNNNNTF